MRLASIKVPPHLKVGKLAILGVRIYPDQTLKVAHRTMLVHIHPDKHHNSPQANAAFRALQVAYGDCEALPPRAITSFRQIPWRSPEETELLKLLHQLSGIQPLPEHPLPPAAPAAAPAAARAADPAGGTGSQNKKEKGKGKGKGKGPSASATCGNEGPDIYNIRTEYINKAAIIEFLSHTAARRARHPNKGSLAQNLEVLLRRGHPVPGDSDILEIVVVSYMNRRFGLATRRQTGIRVFGSEIPDDVQDAITQNFSSTCRTL